MKKILVNTAACIGKFPPTKMEKNLDFHVHFHNSDANPKSRVSSFSGKPDFLSGFGYPKKSGLYKINPLPDYKLTKTKLELIKAHFPYNFSFYSFFYYHKHL